MTGGLTCGGGVSQSGRVQLTWVESKVIDEALPGDEGDLLDGGRGAAETKLLQMQQRVDERTSFMQQLSGDTWKQSSSLLADANGNN